MNNESTPSLPWYKYKFVWFALSIPFSAVIMGVAMIYLAVTTDDGLVADDYYKQGMAINKSLDRERKAAELGISATVEYDREVGQFLVRLQRGTLEVLPASLLFTIEHATRAGNDKQLELFHGQGEQYVGYIKQPINDGIWHVELNTEDWRVGARIDLVDKAVNKLVPEVYE